MRVFVLVNQDASGRRMGNNAVALTGVILSWLMLMIFSIVMISRMVSRVAALGS